MRRDLAALADRTFDLVIVGGGAFGVFAAWDAALRGLSVAILERGDWAEAASANCFKMVHGGIRYLQHLDFARIRQSSRERTAFLRIAPHLVRPLPILIPTYGHGRSGPEILGAGIRAYDLLVWDRNRGIRDPALRFPPSRLLSSRETLALYPELPSAGLTGGALIHDGQMHSPARLALCVLRSAVEQGACAANYVEATGFLRRGRAVEGVVARDREGGGTFDVRARVVLNAAGAWSVPLLRDGFGIELSPRPTFSRDSYFVVNRRLGPDVALAVRGRTRDPDALLSRDARHLFLVPWGRQTLVGVWHMVYEGPPDQVRLPMPHVQAFIDEINWAHPPAGIRADEVCLTQHGLVLFGENAPGATELKYGHRSLFIDHERSDGVPGLLTLIGVRYTTARSEGVRAVAHTARRLGRRIPPTRTEFTAVHGGDVEDRARLVREAGASPPGDADLATAARLVQNYGSAYREVFHEADGLPDALRTIPGLELSQAEIRHSVRLEMARTLGDLVFRRSDAGSGPNPGPKVLRLAAQAMGRELGWDATRVEREVEAARTAFPSQGPERGS